MNLFELNTTTNKLNIQPEAYALGPFRKLWDRSKDKGIAERELAYVYYMTDYKSPFSTILNDEERDNRVRSAVELRDWKPDDLVNNAISFYEEIQVTPSLSLLRSALCAVDQIKNYFTTLKLTDKDAKGSLVNDPAKVTTMLKQMGDVVASLKKTEDEVRKEQATKDKAKGGKDLGMFEKPRT